MKFNWTKFDSQFIYEVLCASELANTKKKQIEYAYSGEDKDMLVGLLNEVCPYPDKRFIMNYRPIIEQSLNTISANGTMMATRSIDSLSIFFIINNTYKPPIYAQF